LGLARPAEVTNVAMEFLTMKNKGMISDDFNQSGQGRRKVSGDDFNP
jgi:hypothetical protein